MASKLRIYSCLQDMYERYQACSVTEKLKFENLYYSLKKTRRKGDMYLHLYHCADEQHYILVHLRYNLPVLIKAFYSIDEVDLKNL